MDPVRGLGSSALVAIITNPACAQAMDESVCRPIPVWDRDTRRCLLPSNPRVQMVRSELAAVMAESRVTWPRGMGCGTALAMR